MSFKSKKTMLVLTGVVCIILVFVSKSGFGEVPKKINYQGYLTNNAGSPISADVDMEFSLWNSSSGGTQLWSESKSNISVVNGLYSVIMGQGNALDLPFDGPYYLQVKVGGEVLSPRQPLTSVAYALRASNSDEADLLDGLDSTDLIASGQVDSVSTAMIQDSAVGTAEIANGSVGNADLANDSVTGAKILDNTITNADLADGSVTTAKINQNIVSSIDGVVNDGGNIDLVAGSNVTITPDDAANTITISASGGGGSGDITGVAAGTGLSGGGTTGDVTLSFDSTYGDGRYVQEGQANSVSTGMIQDNAVGSSEIANGSVGNADLANNAVTAAKISPNIVSSIGGVNNDGGNIDLVAGSNVTITPNDSANTITISSTSGGSGDITGVIAGTGLSGGGLSGDVTLNFSSTYGDGRYVNEGQSNSITSSMLNFNYAVSSSEGGPATDLNCSGCVSSSELNFSAGDITGVTAGNGLTGGGTSGSVTLNVGSGTGISVASSTVSVAVPLSLSGSSSGAIIAGSNSNTSSGYGVWGSGDYGVIGKALDSSGYGVFGENFVSFNNTYGYLGGNSYGVYGQHGSSGHYGYIGGSGRAVFGAANSSGWAGYFAQNSGTGGDVRIEGYCNITGNIFKGGGSFKIDHPLDPGNKYLYHSFVESPDMKNIYDGVVELDENGEAWIDFPDWFEALNRNFRYQLTPIGAPGPNLYVAEEVSDNRFKIAGGDPGMKVSWQVTGIRQDPYANANRIPVEEDKPPEEKGFYLHPEAYGQPSEMRIGEKLKNKEIQGAIETVKEPS